MMYLCNSIIPNTFIWLKVKIKQIYFRYQDFTLGGAHFLARCLPKSPVGPEQRPVGGPGAKPALKLLGIRKYRTSFLNRN